MDYLKGLIKKLIPKNIAAILGVVQTTIPVIRELLMVAARVCATIIPGEADDKIVAVIRKYFDLFEKNFEKIKNFFL